jgi:pimeloyl-ACP methyl ester carboxylesterase
MSTLQQHDDQGRESDAIALAYDDVGTGIPVVLLHGFPHNRELWAAQRDTLAAYCRVITPDLRGCGASDVRGPYTMDQYADDVAALLGRLGVHQAVVGGLSMGGYVTFALWRRHRTRVRAMLLADTRSAADTEEGRVKRRALIDLARRRGAGAVADAQVLGSLGATTRTTHPDIVRHVRDMMATAAVEGIVGALEAMSVRPDSTETLRTIDVPTLILVGEEDIITPVKEARTMHASLTGSTLCVITQAGHLSNVEQPGQFNAAVTRFVTAL